MNIPRHTISPAERDALSAIISKFPGQKTEVPSNGSLSSVCHLSLPFAEREGVLAHRLKTGVFREYAASLTGLIGAIGELHAYKKFEPFLLIENVPLTGENASAMSVLLSLLGGTLLEYLAYGTLIDEIRVRGTPGLRPSSRDNRRFGWHTDLSSHPCPPEFENLFVLQKADRGGNSLLCNVQKAADSLLPRTRLFLQESEFTFPPLPGFENLPPLRAPILTERNGVMEARYRRDGLEGVTAEQNEALDEWDAALDAHAISFSLEPDTALICSNKRAAHAREPFTGDRWFLRTYSGNPLKL